MRYLAYGHVIATPRRLPGLLPASKLPADITIDLTAHPAPAVEWSTTPTPDVDPWLQVALTPDGCVLRFATAVTFVVTPDARTIRVHHEGALTDTIRHLLVDQVLPLAIAHRGSLVLHGAGVVVDGRGIGLVGPSGAGKSTLAGSLLSRAASVFADDALVIDSPGSPEDRAVEEARVHPAYPALRVWPDVLTAIALPGDVPPVAAYTTKRRVQLASGGAAAAGPVIVDRIYIVDTISAPAIGITRLTKRDAVMALLTHSYVLDPSDGRRLRQQFDAASALVERSTVRRLTYPRDLARLPEVGAALVDDFRT